MMKALKARFKIRPIQERYHAISQWFTTPLGRRLMMQERIAIGEEMRYMFGYHFMQLSTVQNANLVSLSRINHCYSMAPVYDGQEGKHAIHGVVNFDELPFEDEVVDVTVLHHVLEFSENPHQVLKEAARVTIPKGYIVIVAFNPFSLAGMFQKIGALMNCSGISRRRALPVGRMRDWLEFLDFSCSSTKHVFYNLPLNNARYLSSTRFIDKLGFHTHMPFGMSVVMVARKDKAGLTPIKPKWEKSHLLDAMPIPKQAIRTKNEGRGLVLPFRTRSGQGQ